MKLLKAIKSAFEAFGMTFFIFLMYGCYDGSFEIKTFLISAGVSIFLVWAINKVFYTQAMNGEVFECPWCGGITPQEDMIEYRGTNFDSIKNLSVDGMGKFLMDWGLACIKNQEPKDVFVWLESKTDKQN